MVNKPVRALLVLMVMAALAICAVCVAEDDHVHNWTAYTVITEPTCTSEGTEVRVCTICGETEVETLAMSDHSYGSWSYYSDDQHVRTCSVCGHTERQAHDAAVAKTVSAAAANRLGKKNITCAACGYNYTRLVSAYDKLYSMEGTDILGNDTSYIKVNTISFPAGNEKQLTLYSDGVFDLYATSNVTVEIYANASSGEYKGIKLTGGKAVLTVSGEDASLEFILPGEGTQISIEFRDGAKGLAVSSCEADLNHISLVDLDDGKKLVTLTRSALDGNTLNIGMRSYAANNVKINYEKDGMGPAEGTLLSSASWSYNTRNRTVSASGENGRLTVMSGETLLLNGASGGMLSEGDVPWGFTCVYASSDGTFTYSSPTYSLEGFLTALPKVASGNGKADEPENTGDVTAEPTPAATDAGSETDGQEVEYLSYPTVMSASLGASPLIELRYDAGTYTVRVSALPSGYKLSRIQFVQKFDGGSMTIKNAFTAEASFDVSNYNGSVLATVYLTDSKGNEKQYEAGSFEYRAS